MLRENRVHESKGYSEVMAAFGGTVAKAKRIHFVNFIPQQDKLRNEIQLLIEYFGCLLTVRNINR